jgi:hypothetical protein
MLGYPERVISARTPSRRAPRRRARPHRRRRLGGLALALLLTLVLAVRALDSGSGSAPTPALANPPRVALAPDGQPQLESLATAPGGLELDVPVTQGRITAIVYHGVGDNGSVPLVPAGHQRNAGLLTRLGNLLAGGGESDGPSYYVDSGAPGDPTGSVDVGAVAGTGVYAPVDGRVVSIRPYVINGTTWGSVVQIQPSSAPALLVTITNVNLSSAISAGATVTAAVTKLGTVADLSKAMSQDVAKFTSDSGNHVHLEVSPAPAAAPIL